MSNKNYYVYILTNKRNTVFYIGVTDDLKRRLYEHKNELIEGFTKKYQLKKLVYFEEYQNINEAIKREKQLKNWHRGWKINLIKNKNPTFKNLSEDCKKRS
jgi:Predicted endonuclease containing a URI domain